jgi:hypothetical protein
MPRLEIYVGVFGKNKSQAATRRQRSCGFEGIAGERHVRFAQKRAYCGCYVLHSHRINTDNKTYDAGSLLRKSCLAAGALRKKLLDFSRGQEINCEGKEVAQFSPGSFTGNWRGRMTPSSRVHALKFASSNRRH